MIALWLLADALRYIAQEAFRGKPLSTARRGPNFAEIVPKFINIGPVELGTKVADSGRNLAEVGRSPSKLGRGQADVGRLRAEFSRSWPMPPQTCSSLGHI